MFKKKIDSALLKSNPIAALFAPKATVVSMEDYTGKSKERVAWEKEMKVYTESFSSARKLTLKRGNDLDWQRVQFRLYVGEQLIHVFARKFDDFPTEGLLIVSDDAIEALNNSAARVRAGGSLYFSPYEEMHIMEALRNAEELCRHLDEMDNAQLMRIYQHVEKMMNDARGR